jgi:spermidine synthase
VLRKIKKIFPILLLIYGLTTLLLQVRLLNELITIFYGNELFTGLILGIWLLFTSLASLWAAKFLKINNLKGILILQLIQISLMLFSVIFIRILASWFFPAEIMPGLFTSFVFISLVLLPICFINGSLFPVLVKLWHKYSKKRLNQVISQAYLLETLGLILAGLVFNFILIKTPFPLTQKLNMQTLKLRQPEIVKQINSQHGSITVTKTQDQYNFYLSGKYVFSNQNSPSNEKLAHLVLTQVKNPKQILIIGNGLNGLIKEALKYQSLKKIDYVELDPQLINITIPYLSPDLKQALADKKVTVNNQDGIRFIKQIRDKYDLVLINVYNPSTALINRYYTQQTYQNINQILNPGGILATTLDLPTDYLSLESQKLLSLISQTLSSVYKYQLILPEDNQVLFINSQSLLTDDPEVVIQTFINANIQTQFVSPQYLQLMLENSKTLDFKTIIKQAPVLSLNTNLKPQAYFYQTAFWQTIFNFQAAKLFGLIAKVNFFITAVMLVVLGTAVLPKIKQDSQASFIYVLSAGFLLMNLEIIIIFLFQTQTGYLFSQIALIFTAILSGVSLGNFLSLNLLLKKQPKKMLKLIFLGQLLFLLILLVIIPTLSRPSIFYVLSLISGFLTGAVFPQANNLLSQQTLKQPMAKGFLYSADLLGAFLGAILPSLFLIPIIGISQTIILLILVSAFNLLLLQKKLEP